MRQAKLSAQRDCAQVHPISRRRAQVLIGVDLKTVLARHPPDNPEMPSFPKDFVKVPLVKAPILKTNDPGAFARRWMSLETLAQGIDDATIGPACHTLTFPGGDAPATRLSTRPQVQMGDRHVQGILAAIQLDYRRLSGELFGRPAELPFSMRRADEAGWHIEVSSDGEMAFVFTRREQERERRQTRDLWEMPYFILAETIVPWANHRIPQSGQVSERLRFAADELERLHAGWGNRFERDMRSKGLY